MKLVKRFKVLYDANDKPTNIPLVLQMEPYFIDNDDWLWQDEDAVNEATKGLQWAMRFRYVSDSKLILKYGKYNNII
jgi:hypothetical protein